MLRKKSKGFTLIELLVVIAIIGILATIVLVSLNSARQKARDTRRVSDMRQVALALEMYYDDNAAYPGDVDATCDDWAAMTTAIQTGGQMTSVPLDPGGNGGVAYAYSVSANDYVLRARLEVCAATGACATDVDGTVLGCDCTDANFFYCIQP